MAADPAHRSGRRCRCSAGRRCRRGAPLALCPTGDALAPGSRCFHDAYVAGVDGRWRSESGDYTVTGQAIGSLIANGPPRTLPDGTVVKSGDTGPALNLHAAGAVDFEAYGRRVDFNDLGFMTRQNLVKEHANSSTASSIRAGRRWRRAPG